MFENDLIDGPHARDRIHLVSGLDWHGCFIAKRRSKALSTSLLEAKKKKQHLYLLKPMLPSAQGLQFMIFIQSFSPKCLAGNLEFHTTIYWMGLVSVQVTISP